MRPPATSRIVMHTHRLDGQREAISSALRRLAALAAG
jgi:hypothetical protein